MNKTANVHVLSVRQAALELGKSPRTVIDMIRLGKLAGSKLGDGRTSAYVITRAEVERVKLAAAAVAS